ncbi:hypothetical protein [Methylobacterium thuringiense]|uniref:Uncharacterized protein n=1 Tax=Methylobacterium thuringiense TaxID=1003091 RepID=A0ABQ4TLZ1_9HYPH|nr:hypothetical protein [Methylobacterium thuringiense]GJE55884.1 hypothetical protein EKPJFOCH_2381 [Methylobacterium thuringiense]
MIDLSTSETDRTVDALLRQITWSRFAGDAGIEGPYRDDPASAAVVIELRQAGERLAAAGGLDALDEAILRITEMNSSYSDQRSNLLEALWSSVGRGGEP